jgi:hypothetical protein
MSFTKNSDVKNHISAQSGTHSHSFVLPNQPGAIDRSESGLGAKATHGQCDSPDASPLLSSLVALVNRHDGERHRQDGNQYWCLISIRAAVALAASAFLIFLPGMMRSMFLMPMAVISMLFALAIYGIADSLTLMVAGLKVTTNTRWHRALLIQATLGIAIGMILATVAFSATQVQWFVPLAAGQAFIVGFVEIAMARRALHSSGDRIASYATGIVAIISGMVLLMIIKADVVDLMRWLTGYIALLGFSLLFLSIRLGLSKHHDMTGQPIPLGT